MAKRCNARYRSNPQGMTAAVLIRDVSIKRLAGQLGVTKNAVLQLMREETPLTFKKVCQLRKLLGRGVVIDETEISS